MIPAKEVSMNGWKEREGKRKKKRKGERKKEREGKRKKEKEQTKQERVGRKKENIVVRIIVMSSFFLNSYSTILIPRHTYLSSPNHCIKKSYKENHRKKIIREKNQKIIKHNERQKRK